MKEEYSKNERAKKVCGLRTKGNPIDFPCELGYFCPKNKKHRLEWSEYNYFIWCEQCNFDYPSPVCLRDYRKSANIFLDILTTLNK